MSLRQAGGVVVGDQKICLTCLLNYKIYHANFLEHQQRLEYQWIEMHSINHERFEREFGGKVFFVYSIKNSGKKKRIYNVEVIEQIRAEIQRLEN